MTPEEQLQADIKKMSENQLIDRAAHYNAALRKGYALQSEARTLLDANINLFTICQNELYSRLQRRIEYETNRTERP